MPRVRRRHGDHAGVRRSPRWARRGEAVVARNEAVLSRNDAQRRQEQAEELLAFMLGNYRGELQNSAGGSSSNHGRQSAGLFRGDQSRDLSDIALARQAKRCIRWARPGSAKARANEAADAFANPTSARGPHRPPPQGCGDAHRANEGRGVDVPDLCPPGRFCRRASLAEILRNSALASSRSKARLRGRSAN